MFYRSHAVPPSFRHDVLSIPGDPDVVWARCAIDPRRSRRRLGTMRYRSHAVRTSSGHDALSIPRGPDVVWARCAIDPSRSRRRLGTMRYRSPAVRTSFGHDALSIPRGPDVVWARCAIDPKRGAILLRTMRHRSQTAACRAELWKLLKMSRLGESQISPNHLTTVKRGLNYLAIAGSQRGLIHDPASGLENRHTIGHCAHSRFLPLSTARTSEPLDQS